MRFKLLRQGWIGGGDRPLELSRRILPSSEFGRSDKHRGGEKTLSNFFATLKPVRFLLMAVWRRNKCPASSTLSRFLEAINDCSLEKLRTLFEQDLWERGFKGEDQGGLVDRTGERYWLFDLDGTKQAARQRSLTSKEEYPPGQRRSGKACAKGYRGRKRGQASP